MVWSVIDQHKLYMYFNQKKKVPPNENSKNAKIVDITEGIWYVIFLAAPAGLSFNLYWKNDLKKISSILSKVEKPL